MIFKIATRLSGLVIGKSGSLIGVKGSTLELNIGHTYICTNDWVLEFRKQQFRNDCSPLITFTVVALLGIYKS